MAAGWVTQLTLGVALGLCASIAVAQEPPQQPQAPPGPPAVEWRGQGLKIEVAPLLIEPATAFFLNRGFPFTEAERIAEQGCVFRSAIGHAGQEITEHIHIDLTQWQVRATGNKGPWLAYRSKEEWLTSFTGKAIPDKALIAFRWALFPTQQSFGPGDSNWGIHAFGLPRGTRFDLRVVWRLGDKRQETVLEDLACSDQ